MYRCRLGGGGGPEGARTQAPSLFFSIIALYYERTHNYHEIQVYK